jgi:hypothetical protein
VYPLGMYFLACSNAMMTLDVDKLAVGDVGPFGIGVCAIVLHVIRFRKPTFADRALILCLGAVVGMLLGALIQLKFKVTPMGLATAPLLAGLVGWTWLRSRIRFLVRWEQNPMAAGFMTSRAAAYRALADADRRIAAKAKAKEAKAAPAKVIEVPSEPAGKESSAEAAILDSAVEHQTV